MSTFNHRKYRAFHPVALPDRTWPDRVIESAPQWCSVDLRDGNQALMEPMSVSQKLKMFQMLVDVGFKEIEVGFPAAAQTEFDFLRTLIERDLIPDDVTVQVLTQARDALIERTFEALKGVRRAIVHVYNSTSKVQRDQVFRLDRQGIIDIAVNGARKVKTCAAAQPDTEWVFQYSPESFTGTELDFAVEICDAVTAVWLPTAKRPVIINLPATVEMATPNVYADQIEWFCRHVANREAIVLSLHTHNDRGCAVAAAELAVMAGADRVEGTLLGNGERTGNMDIITMAMNMYSQGVDPKLDFSDIDSIVHCVKECTQLPVHPRHPYAGELVFTAFSGSHQDAIKKCLTARDAKDPWEVAYLPIDPEDLGRTYQEVIRINSQSGKGGVAYLLERDHGLQVPRWLQIDFSPVVQREAEATGTEVSSQQIWQLFQRTYIDHTAPLRLESYRIERDQDDRLVVNLLEQDQPLILHGRGAGVMEAFVDAVSTHFKCMIEIMDYSEHALTEGTDAEAVTYLSVRIDGKSHISVAIHSDMVTATLCALVGAVNQYRTVSGQQAA